MANGIDWFRWHHGSVNDPKFGLVAKRAGASVAEVIAVWACLLEQASAAEDRGDPGTPDFEAIDFALGMNDGTARRVYERMRERELIDSSTGRIAAWEKRQPKREDDTAAERKRRQRERDREQKADNVTREESRTVTHGHAHVTQCHDRGEESREEKNSLSLRSREPRAPAPEEAASPTLAGQACAAMKRAGLPKVNPSDPRLLQLLSQGVTPTQLGDLAAELRVGRLSPPPMAYVLATMAGRLADAAAQPEPQRPSGRARDRPRGTAYGDEIDRIAASIRGDAQASETIEVEARHVG